MSNFNEEGFNTYESITDEEAISLRNTYELLNTLKAAILRERERNASNEE